jgi:hypothetical protein
MTEQQKAQMFDELQRKRVIVISNGHIHHGDTKSITVPDWVKTVDAEEYERKQKEDLKAKKPGHL